jgi:hypothetical protein
MPQRPTSHRILCISALLGGALLVVLRLSLQPWSAWVTGHLNDEDCLVLAGPLVAVPLGLAVISRQWGNTARIPFINRAVPFSLLATLQPVVAALAFACHFFPRTETLSGLVTLPWLAFCVLCALDGLARLAAASRARDPAHAAVAIGLIYLPVGAAWLSMFRFGIRPLDFPDIIVILTAGHFHFAGFCAPLLIARMSEAMRHAGSRLARPVAKLALTATAGMPLVAAGITLTQLGFKGLEVYAALSFAAILTAFATLGITWSLLQLPRRRRFLLHAVSCASLIAAMALAALYAIGNASGTPILSILDMIRWHAAIIVCGFAIPGLVGWVIADRAAPQTAPTGGTP